MRTLYLVHRRKLNFYRDFHINALLCVYLLKLAIADHVDAPNKNNYSVGPLNQDALPSEPAISNSRRPGTIRLKPTRSSSNKQRDLQQTNHGVQSQRQPQSANKVQDQNSPRFQSIRTQYNNNRPEEIASVDCRAKREEILSRQGASVQHNQHREANSTNTVHPRSPPKIENRWNFDGNETQLMNSFYGEHVPECNQEGGYESIQCHQIGYCWCVNKYGLPIKNTAVIAGEEPSCDPNIYDSFSNDSLVVAGVSLQRINSILKSGSTFESTTPNGHLNFEAPETSTDPSLSHSDDDSYQDETNHQADGKPRNRGPIMPLIPNDCKGSRDNARERATIFANDSIWIPDCDHDNANLYAEKQCHRSKICWCVDQATGLPLRTNEQLTNRASNSNCTELKKLMDLASQPKPQVAFYMGSSNHCDADKRVDFIISLSNQFRHQINEYFRTNPSSLNNLPQGVSSTNPFAIKEIQVSKLKFNIMDRDQDGRLGDREWSKFKNNFKLINRTDELDNPIKHRKSPYFPLAPLLILRTQRKCWRDFLEFCGSRDSLVDESISLDKWLSCTEVPSRSESGDGGHHFHPHNYRRVGAATNLEDTYAHSREAAINRSKMRNPFLQILKPD